MADENKDNSDIYQLRDPSVLTEKVIAPPENSEIFAIKESVIGVTLGAGIALCNAYRIDKRLTNDESGETWKASDLKASRNVVVYLPPLDIRLDSAAIESVSQTARHVEALEHPRIVPLLDNFTDPEHGFFAVRKFVNGKTLDVYQKEYIKRYKGFSPAKALKILHDVALALDYAHRADVVHSAICPKNIIVGLDDEVNVANFALLSPQTFAPAAQQSYLAPEIAEGLSPTASSDIYSLAVVAYELFAGRLPVPTDGGDDTPLPIPNVPSSVDAVIRKAMIKNPEDRFESCSAFVKELEKSFQGSLKNKSILVTPAHISPRKKLPEGLSYGIMLVVVLCITGIALWQTQPPVDSKQAADKGKQQAVPLPAPAKVDDRQQLAVVSKPQVEPLPPPINEDGGQQTADGNKPQAEPLAPSVNEDGGQQTADGNKPQAEPLAPSVRRTSSRQVVEVSMPQAEPLAPSAERTSSRQVVEDSKPQVEVIPPVPQEPVVTEVVPEKPAETEPTVIEENVDIPPESEPEPTVIETKIVSVEPTVEPETPPQAPETLLDAPKQESFAASPADLLREDGEQKPLQIGGIECRFKWCKGNPYLQGAHGFWIQEKPITQAVWLAVMKVHAGYQLDDVNVRLPEVNVSWRDIDQFLEKINLLDVLSEEEFRGCQFAIPTEQQWERVEPDNRVMEWCNNWADDTKTNRVVRGKDVPPQQRNPSAPFENIGFRLVIVPKEPVP